MFDSRPSAMCPMLRLGRKAGGTTIYLGASEVVVPLESHSGACRCGAQRPPFSALATEPGRLVAARGAGERIAAPSFPTVE